MDNRRHPAIIRARIRAYNALTHTADIEPISAPEALMDDVPCLQDIPASNMIAGRTASVLLWADIGGLVLGVYGLTPTIVIDSRCDDTINSGDATTDGVIDALRDAMITHGLIAAA